MASKRREDNLTASVSSTGKTSISFRLSTLITGLLFIVIIVVSFYGGVIYQKSQQPASSSTSSEERIENRRFALGPVVYISPSSITIDNEHTGSSEQLKITNKTLLSIDGSPAKTSQVKVGEVALIRVSKNSTAAIILINSQFTD